MDRNSRTWGQAAAPGTRERIVRLLAGGARTTGELARALEVTPNAVRAQLALLRRERVIEEAGRARGSRRPAVIYRLAAGAEARLSRAYPLALARLVQAAAEKLRGPAFVELLRAMGRRLAMTFPPASGEAGQRVAAARSALEELGSRVEVSKQGGKYILRCDSCPLGEAVVLEDKTCIGLATMLQELTGLPVQECCEHGEHPRCGFQIEVPPRGVS